MQRGGNFSILDLFANGKRRGLGRRLVDHGRHRSMVDRAQGLGGGSTEDSRNGAPVCGASPWLRKKGEGKAVIFIS
jgi:hypothetical protein